MATKTRRKRKPSMNTIKKQLFEEYEANIAMYGRQVIGVFPTRDDTFPMNFAYTIGNHEKGFPELLVIGPSGEESMGLLNALSTLMIERGTSFYDGETVQLIGAGVALKMRAVGQLAKSQFTTQVTAYYQEAAYDVQQVVIPDPNGRYPSEPGCAPPYRDVPILNDTMH